MNLPLVFRPEADQDLIDAHAWHESQSAGLGDVFARRAAETVEVIRRTPALYGRVWRNVRATLIRRHSYLVYCRILTDRVEIVAVQHGRRDASIWKSRV